MIALHSMKLAKGRIKKNNYGFSEHGPISFYPPSYYWFSEQNYSENL